MEDVDAEKIEATAIAAAKQRSLELLFDYTKFHIGLYLTLTASYVAVSAIKKDGGADKQQAFALTIDPHWFWPAVICFMLAGLAGGVIASSITQTSARSSKAFLQLAIGPGELKVVHFKALWWTWIEHTAFWAGLICAVISARP